MICYKDCIRLWAAWFDIARDGLVLVIDGLKVLMPCVANQHDIATVASAAVANQKQLQAVERQKEQFKRRAQNRVIPTLSDAKTQVKLPLAVTICVCLRRPQRLAVS